MMRFSLLLLLFLPSCFHEPSKEELIEYCADAQYFSNAKLTFNNDNFKVMYHAWKLDSTSFKYKFEKLYRYKVYTRSCEKKYKEAPVEFKLRYIDTRKDINADLEKRQWSLDEADHKLMKKVKKDWKENLKK